LSGADSSPLEGGGGDDDAVVELTVLLADDQVGTRVGIRYAIEPHGFRVVAEASSVAEAVAAALRTAPDICLVATGLPGNGIEAARLIKQTVPKTKIVMLTATGRNDELLGALRAGADGYLLMTTSPTRLPHAIRGVANGEAALPRAFTAHLIQEFRAHGHRRRLALSIDDQAVELTAREFEVLERLRKKERTAEIAAHLGISEVTVRRHSSSILQKLGAPNRQAVIDMLDRAEQQPQATPGG
jgi:DNA-binding NarL/FixJ family response regulator